MACRGRLCIFARRPVLGTVKTRLAAEIGEVAALTAHIELTEGVLERCVAPEAYDTELWLAGAAEADEPVVARWLERYGIAGREQSSGDLGERMRFALEAKSGPTVLIGSDLLDVDASYIAGALKRLEEADVVLGPAEDGGYGLIGALRPVPELFAGIDWGTSRVFTQTSQCAREAGLRVAVLTTLRDVDTPAEWRAWQARASGLDR